MSNSNTNAKTLARERDRAERIYLRNLNKLVNAARNTIRGIDDPDAVMNTLDRFFKSSYANDLFRGAARQMATMIDKGQYNTWREAATASSRGREVAATLMREMKTQVGGRIASIVEENAKLIKTVHSSIASQLSAIAKEGWAQGLRPAQIAAQMRELAPRGTVSTTHSLRKDPNAAYEDQIRLIARTETAKASTALVEARSEALGLNWYIWETADDTRVRESHDFMDGVLCRWSEPPNPERLNTEKRNYGAYHPGGIFNCRCIALPVISYRDIGFPARVHKAGEVKTCGDIETFMEQYA